MEVSQDNETPGGLIIRHWNGRLPIAESFWLILVGLGVLLWVERQWVHEVAYQIDSLYLPGAIIAGNLILNFMIGVWQVVGTWNSANIRYLHPETKPPIYTIITRVFLYFSLISYSLYLVFVLIFSITAIYLVIITYAKGDNNEYSIQMVRPGVIGVSGSITYGLPSRLREYIETEKEIVVVLLDSSGGYIEPAKELYQIIHSHNLGTSVLGQCLSACVYPFLGGKVRILATNGRLGFHMPRQKIGFIEIPDDSAEEESILLSVGVSKEFISKVGNFRSEETWNPTLATLAKENIITHVFDSETNAVTSANDYCESNRCN